MKHRKTRTRRKHNQNRTQMKSLSVDAFIGMSAIDRWMIYHESPNLYRQLKAKKISGGNADDR